MQVWTMEGTPGEMGRAHGEMHREAIHDFYGRRLENAMVQALDWGGRRVTEDQALAVASACLEPTRDFHPEGYEELVGIAEGADLPLEKIMLLNGLTDLRDVLSWDGDLESLGGCSAFIAQRDVTADGQTICGQTWDLATDNMPFVIGVHRKPKEGPETWCLTTAGCLSLIGMNSLGLAVGTTNLRCTDARIGVVYLSIIHRLLTTCTTVKEAVGVVGEAPRAGAHYYMLADAAGRSAGVECTATRFHARPVTRGVFVHCNHCLDPQNVLLEGREPSPSTLTRTARLRTLLEAKGGSIDPKVARKCLSDTTGGDQAICRNDTLGISSNGAVIMVPQRGEIQACHGLPNKAKWVSLRAEAETA